MSDSIRQALEEIARSRSNASWNDRFAHWERPASESEEQIIARAAGYVRRALAANDWLSQESVEVRPQGSYHNNTNVRRESDMDLCIWHPTIHLVAEPGVLWGDVLASGAYRHSGRQIPDIAAQVRAELFHTLVAQFGYDQVRTGTKAVTVSGIPGSRADTDAVPASRMHYIFNYATFPALQPELRYVEGVAITGSDGKRILNFPEQHYLNGRAKRERTAHRYKKVVRILKRLRDELVDLGYLREGQVPSFLVECLAYRVEDEDYLQNEGRLARVKRILIRMNAQLTDPTFVANARETNDIKPLFSKAYPWHQPWSLGDALAFVVAGWNRVHA